MGNNKLLTLFLITILLLIITIEIICCHLFATNYISYIVLILTTILVNIKLKKTEEIRNIIILDLIFVISIFIFEPIVVSISQLISYLFYRKKEFSGNLLKLLLTFIIPIVVLGLLHPGYIELMGEIFLESFIGFDYEFVFFTLVLEYMLILNTIILLSYKIIFTDDMQFSNTITIVLIASIFVLICIAGWKLFNNLSSLNKANEYLTLLQNTYNNNTIIENYDTIKAEFYPPVSIQDVLNEENPENLLDFNNMPNLIGASIDQYFEVLVGSHIQLYNQTKRKTEKQKMAQEIQIDFGRCIDDYETYVDNLHYQTAYICVIYVIQITYVCSIYVISRKNKEQLWTNNYSI